MFWQANTFRPNNKKGKRQGHQYTEQSDRDMLEDEQTVGLSEKDNILNP